MRSTFGGMELGRSALNAFRLGMQTVGHNISNMNTEGYSRQRVIFSTVTPENIPNVGQVGQGMSISSIERIRDEFLDFQFRDAQSTLGYWEKVSDLYDSIQNYISEPNSSGIRSAMDTFFTGIQTVQEKPEDTAARQALVTSANSLGTMLGSLIDNFESYNESINLELQESVDEANRMLHNMAELNLRISNAESLGQNANDLRDQRDLLIDKLSKMMDISYNEPKEHNGITGEFFLSVGGRVLVQGTHVRELAAHSFMWDGKVYYDVQVSENEFDIVSNVEIADALAVGPEGTYQLNVERVANGVEWTTGGGDAHCLETYAAKTSDFLNTVCAGGNDDLMTFSVTTSAFPRGVILDSSSEKRNTIIINVDGQEYGLTITRTKDDADNDIWSILDSDGNEASTDGDTLTVQKLADFISNNNSDIKASVENNRLTLSPDDLPASIDIAFSNDILGTITEEKGPGVAGTFDLYAGTQSKELTSNTLTNGITTSGTFRIYLSGDDVNTQLDITIDSSGYFSSDLGNEKQATNTPTVTELVEYLNDTFKSAPASSGLAKIYAEANDDGTFTLKTHDGCVLSVSDIDESGLAGELFAETTEKFTIQVENTDNIDVIRDKINAEAGSYVTASTSRGYLSITAKEYEEDDEDKTYLMTLSGNDDTDNEELLSLLGLTTEEVINAETGETRTVSNIKERGEMLSADSEDIPYKLQFRSIDEDSNASVLNVKIDRVADGWKLRAELDGSRIVDSDGNEIYREVIVNTDSLTTGDIERFVNGAVDAANSVLTDKTLNLNARDDQGRLTFYTDGRKQLEVTDYSGFLGTLTEATQEISAVNMRAEPSELDDALNISGSFRIQVGTQGTRVTSDNFRSNPSKGLPEGGILAAGSAGEKYTFRIGVSGDQMDISATWNNSINKWVLSSDLGTSLTVDNKTDINGKGILTVEDLTGFISDTLRAASSSDNPALSGLNVVAGKPSTGKEYTQFYIESKDNYLLSISDVEGDLASRLGIKNENPVITINVDTSDSLITIRNKINEKYQEEFGLTEPEQWVHASVDDGYLTISANVAGEAQRITLMGSEDGNMQVLRRLGLTQNQRILLEDVTDESGNPVYSYREVAYIPESGIAQDASFTLNNVRYLSSDNKFNLARKIPATTGDTRSRYTASELEEVSAGMWLNLKNAGSTTINVRHHITDGSIKGLEEARDQLIPNLESELDEMAYSLAKNVNAYQYSGYGIAGDITETGRAFFNVQIMKSGAASRLSVTDKVAADPSLIGAAMGKKDSDGKAEYGTSSGSGDGTNAARMNGLNFAKVLEHGTMSIAGVYDAMISQIGTEAGYAKLMYTTEYTVSDQIDSQRQACSGVNLDEELMDMIILNRAFGAMSRYITAIDEMLNTIINGFGLVGR